MTAAHEQPDKFYLAREVWASQTAFMALDDPAKVRRATRIVRAALAREMLRTEDLTPLPEPARKNRG